MRSTVTTAKRRLFGDQAMAVTLPLGLLVLFAISGEAFRWIVAAVCLVLVALMLTGWRWRREVVPGQVYGIGALCGFLGGVAGIPGPPMLLFYMARPLPPEVVRATSMLFLVVFDVILFVVLAIQGKLELLPIFLGLCLAPIYMGAMGVGALMFQPGREGQYRAVAYAIITLAALASLPIWGSI